MVVVQAFLACPLISHGTNGGIMNHGWYAPPRVARRSLMAETKAAYISLGNIGYSAL